MKKKINLLVSRQDSVLIVKKVRFIRNIITVISLSTLILLLFFLFFLFLFNSETKSLMTKKEALLEEIKDNALIDKKIELFTQYANEINILKQSDVNFLPYYKILIDSLSSATESAQLSSITVDNKRNVAMKLNFISYDSLMSFTNVLQSQEFLNKFQSLNLESFSLLNGDMINYSLIVKGTFVPIK